MGFRYRKSIKLGKGTRLNLSKSGVGISTGVKGARISVNSKGTRRTLSVPGTGLSYITHKSHGSNRRSNKTNGNNEYAPHQVNGTGLQKGKYYPLALPIIYTLLTIVFLVTGQVVPAIIVGFLSFIFFKKTLSIKNKAYKLYNKSLKARDNVTKLELLQQAKDIDYNNDLANYHLAVVYFDNNDLVETLNYIKDIEDHKNINQLELGRMYIISLYETGEYQQIINELESNMESDLSNKLLVALSYKALGQVKKASEIFATGPVNKRTYTDDVLIFKYHLGLCYLELGEKSKAVTQLKKVYEVDSSYEDIVEYAQDLDFAVGEHVN